jgi:hypothetical protein
MQAIAFDLARQEYYKGLRLLLSMFNKQTIRQKQLHQPLLDRLERTYTIS